MQSFLLIYLAREFLCVHCELYICIYATKENFRIPKGSSMLSFRRMKQSTKYLFQFFCVYWEKLFPNLVSDS